MRTLTRLCTSALLAGLLSCAGSVAARAPDPSSELIAAYIYNFARFVEWPAATFPSPLTPFTLCTPDAETLDGHLLRIHGRLAQNRRVEVRQVSSDDSLAECQMLFLPADTAEPESAWLAAAAGKPLLTVSNAPGFTARGGMIGLFIAADRVQFDILRDATLDAGLRVSSRLLALARKIAGGAR